MIFPSILYRAPLIRAPIVNNSCKVKENDNNRGHNDRPFELAYYTFEWQCVCVCVPLMLAAALSIDSLLTHTYKQRALIRAL